jgi:hypothetical protein
MANEDPHLLAEQLSTFTAACNPTCENLQAAAHLPLNPIILGDSNGDGQFDNLDIVHVLEAGKYKSGQQATFSEGDWNSDGVFDALDIISALQSARYVSSANAALVALDAVMAGR